MALYHLSVYLSSYFCGFLSTSSCISSQICDTASNLAPYLSKSSSGLKDMYLFFLILVLSGWYDTVYRFGVPELIDIYGNFISMNLFVSAFFFQGFSNLFVSSSIMTNVANLLYPLHFEAIWDTEVSMSLLSTCFEAVWDTEVSLSLLSSSILSSWRAFFLLANTCFRFSLSAWLDDFLTKLFRLLISVLTPCTMGLTVLELASSETTSIALSDSYLRFISDGFVSSLKTIDFVETFLASVRSILLDDEIRFDGDTS